LATRQGSLPHIGNIARNYCAKNNKKERFFKKDVTSLTLRSYKNKKDVKKSEMYQNAEETCGKIKQRVSNFAKSVAF